MPIFGIEVKEITTTLYFAEADSIEDANQKAQAATEWKATFDEDNLHKQFGCLPNGTPKCMCPAGNVESHDVEFKLFITGLPDIVEATNTYWSDADPERVYL